MYEQRIGVVGGRKGRGGGKREGRKREGEEKKRRKIRKERGKEKRVKKERRKERGKEKEKVKKRDRERTYQIVAVFSNIRCWAVTIIAATPTNSTAKFSRTQTLQ